MEKSGSVDSKLKKNSQSIYDPEDLERELRLT